MNERFGKEYKLCSKIVIEEIFSDGNQVRKYPFVLRYLPTDLPMKTSFQIVISVPKRLFMRAVDRNRIKRKIREVIRKKKHLLEEKWETQEKKMALFLIYTAHKDETYHTIDNEIETLFLRLIERNE